MKIILYLLRVFGLWSLGGGASQILIVYLWFHEGNKFPDNRYNQNLLYNQKVRVFKDHGVGHCVTYYLFSVRAQTWAMAHSYINSRLTYYIVLH